MMASTKGGASWSRRASWAKPRSAIRRARRPAERDATSRRRAHRCRRCRSSASRFRPIPYGARDNTAAAAARRGKGPIGVPGAILRRRRRARRIVSPSGARRTRTRSRHRARACGSSRRAAAEPAAGRQRQIDRRAERLGGWQDQASRLGQPLAHEAGARRRPRQRTRRAAGVAAPLRLMAMASGWRRPARSRRARPVGEVGQRHERRRDDAPRAEARGSTRRSVSSRLHHVGYPAEKGLSGAFSLRHGRATHAQQPGTGQRPSRKRRSAVLPPLPADVAHARGTIQRRSPGRHPSRRP